MKVRIKFAKYGPVKFVGHLDTMHFFQKAVRRADIDIKYSEGFSPHQIMSFAAPLGVGIESFGEYMDIEVNSMTSPEELRDSLNREMVEGMEVVSVHILPDKAKNAMASVAAASYQIHCKKGGFGVDDLAKTAEVFFAQETIPYTKETKKSVIELDLKQGIYAFCASEAKVEINSMSAVAAVLAKGISQSQLKTIPCICMTVNASSSGNVKPSVVLKEFCTFAGVDIPPSAYQITRVETYADLAKDGEEQQRFVPL